MTPHIIKARNVSFALREACNWLKVAGLREESRNGPVLRAPGPVTVVYSRPRERVLFHPTRNANPFFHFFESLWMLAGRNDIGFLEQFLPRMREFSDDGRTLNAAYGYRWRHYYTGDQLDNLIVHLKANPTSRRAVLEMWSERDLDNNSKDVPCNTHAYFERDQGTGALNMTVCNRSNDLIWGMCGANAVHFSYLQEYLAGMLGWPVGVYVQFSNNLHLYLERHAKLMHTLALGHEKDYTYNVAQPYGPLVEDPSCWDLELYEFLLDPLLEKATGEDYNNDFFISVAVPMYAVWDNYHRQGELQGAITLCGDIAAEDWRVACREWLQRKAEDTQ